MFSFASCSVRKMSYLLPLLLGGVMLLLGIEEAHKNQALLNQGLVATGTVVGMDTLHGYNGSQPIVRFSTLDTRSVQKVFANPLGSRYQTGEKVPVLYHPQNPLQAKIYSTNGLYAPMLLSFVLTLLFWSIALLVLIRHRRITSISSTAHSVSDQSAA